MDTKKLSETYLFYTVLGVLALFSWVNWQPYESYVMDADMAIWFSIAESPHLPDGFYFWGQGRLGSLIPLLAHGLTYMGITPVFAVALINVSFQIAISVLALKVSKSALTGTFAAFMFLFPPWSFQYLTLIGHPYTQQAFLFLLTLYLYQRLGIKSGSKIVLFSALFLFQLWVSDISIILLPLLGWMMWKDNGITGKKWALGFLGVAAAYLIILILKNQVPRSSQYGFHLADINGVYENLTQLIAPLDYLISIGMLGIMSSISLAIVLFYGLIKGRGTLASRLTLGFGFLLLITTLLSEWVSRNGSPRYMLLPLCMIALGITMRWSHERFKVSMVATILLTLSMAGFAYQNTRYMGPEMRSTKDRPTRLEAEELGIRVEYPLIGDYWSTYMVGGLTSGVEATTHLKYECRNVWLWETVVQSDTLQYVGRDSDSVITVGGRPFNRLNIPDTVGKYLLSTYAINPNHD